MKKQVLSLFLAAVSGFIGTGLIYSRPEIKVEDPEPEVIEEVQEEEPVEEVAEIKVESKPSTTKPSTTKPSTPSKPSTPTTPSKPSQPSKPADTTVIYTYEDYEKTILGTCPSQRNKSNSWEEGNRLNAIGIITSGVSKTSPIKSLNSYIEGWWNGYRLGKWSTSKRYLMANLMNISGFDSNWVNANVGFYIDFDGLFVNWDNAWSDGHDFTNLSDEQAAKLNKMASDGTHYLRWLDSTYNAKCPND